VDIEFDPEKDAANQAKHGFELSLAIHLFSGRYHIDVDDRRDYGEVRKIATGYIGERLFVCVFTERKTARRIISIRKANKREQHDYRQSNSGNGEEGLEKGGLEKIRRDDR
jgi:uncharacterized protein